MISMDKRYVTRDGRPVRVIAVDRKDPFCVVALVGNDEQIFAYTKEGSFVNPSKEAQNDLVEAPPEKTFYVPVTMGGNNVRYTYDTIYDAEDDYPRHEKIAITFCPATRAVRAEFVK